MPHPCEGAGFDTGPCPHNILLYVYQAKRCLKCKHMNKRLGHRNESRAVVRERRASYRQEAQRRARELEPLYMGPKAGAQAVDMLMRWAL
jgi:hypothetical protein